MVRFPGKERALATAATPDGTSVTITRHELVVRGPDGAVLRQTPWHLVDSGTMSDDGVLRVGVVGEHGLEPALVLPLGPRSGHVPEAFFERVQATVVLAEDVDAGPDGRARVAIRKDLRTSELLEQVVLSAKADEHSDALWSLVQDARARLRDQTGMAPV